MKSPRALGILALGAVILAAISFAAVDITLSSADDDSLPAITVLCAVVGTIALLASVLPAITWFIDTVHHARHDTDIESMRLVRVPFDEEEL